MIQLAYEKKKELSMWQVLDIVNGNTIKVSPNWKWAEKVGNLVVITGYSVATQSLPPEIANSIAKSRLESLIRGKEVKLRNVIRHEGTTIHCEVWVDDVNVANYFPDFNK